MNEYREMSDEQLLVACHELRLAHVEHEQACRDMTECHDIVRGRIAELLQRGR